MNLSFFTISVVVPGADQDVPRGGPSCERDGNGKGSCLWAAEVGSISEGNGDRGPWTAQEKASKTSKIMTGRKINLYGCCCCTDGFWPTCFLSDDKVHNVATIPQNLIWSRFYVFNRLTKSICDHLSVELASWKSISCRSGSRIFGSGGGGGGFKLAEGVVWSLICAVWPRK